jgi:NTP pyrophosphatase (non-canonical NTP hydrolase)
MKDTFKEVRRINKLDPASKAERLCKLFEEAGELAQAVNKSIGRKVVRESKEELKELICEEAADTIQCTMSLIDEFGISYEELIDKLIEKNIKWEKVIEKRKKSAENLKK